MPSRLDPLLLAHPDQPARLRADLLASAIEEVLRYASPVQQGSAPRHTPGGACGQTVEPNQIVVNWLGSANHDEQVFSNLPIHPSIVFRAVTKLPMRLVAE